VYPREIYKEALFINATAVMLSHNHPSGDLQPSPQDMDITNRIKLGMELMGLTLYDHIIVGGDKAVSLEEMGKLSTKKTFKDLGKAALPLSENTRKPGQKPKPVSIMEKLALAKEQVNRESKAAAPQKVNNNRGSR